MGYCGAYGQARPGATFHRATVLGKLDITASFAGHAMARGSACSKSFPRAAVQLERDPVRIRLRKFSEVGPVGGVLAQQAVGVLVRSPLPWTARIAKYICTAV